MIVPFRAHFRWRRDGSKTIRLYVRDTYVAELVTAGAIDIRMEADGFRLIIDFKNFISCDIISFTLDGEYRQYDKSSRKGDIISDYLKWKATEIIPCISKDAFREEFE